MALKPEKEVNEMENTTNAKKSSFVKDTRTEFKKIIWPTRQEARSKTVTVIVTSLIFGLIVFCMDSVYTVAYNFIMGLFM